MSIAKIKRREIVIFAICIAAMLALLLPAIVASRQAAHQMQSSNNLRQLGLAVSNYESTHRRLPAGALRHNSQPVLGWLVSIHPYLEASSWYGRIDQDLPFDHPASYFHFLHPMPTVQHPGIDEQFTEDGFTLTHYMANPNLLSLRPHVRMNELTAGASCTWLFGEASGNYQPMAYAYNWRPLAWPLLDGPDSFGIHRAAQFVMVDGSLQTFSQSTDRQVIETLAAAPPLADRADTLRPTRTFKLTNFRGQRRRITIATSQKVPTKEGGNYEIIFAASSHTAEYARIPSVNEFIKSTELDLATAVKRYPTLRVIEVSEINDHTVELLAKLPQLETIVCLIPQLSDRGWSQLKSLPKLKLISSVSAAYWTEPTAEQLSSLKRLHDELPGVEIHLRTR